MLNDQSIIDVRKIVTGKDGQLFVTDSSGNQIFLAEVNTFHSQINFQNTAYHPVGSALEYQVNTGYGVTLSLTETVIRDDVLLTNLISDLLNGYVPTYDFQGKLNRAYDGQVSRHVFRNCLPTGSVDLMNVTPGQIIQRPWTFAVNATPELLDFFKS